MKKVLFFAVFAFFAMTATYAQASFGAKAGVNFASLNGDDVDDLDGRTNFHIGGVANFELSELISLQPELVFSQQGAKYEDNDGTDKEEGTLKLSYINIPVLLDFTLAEGFSLQAGPQFGINVVAEEEYDYSYEIFGETISESGTEDIDDVETLDMGVAAGAQFKMENGLFFQARYVIGFSEIIKDVKAKNSVVSLSVGWFFN